jgi:hypothetical protein
MTPAAAPYTKTNPEVVGPHLVNRILAYYSPNMKENKREHRKRFCLGSSGDNMHSEDLIYIM